MPGSVVSYKPRFVTGFAATVGSATLPQGSLYAVAGIGYSLIEAGFSGGGAGSKRTSLQRLTSAGTPGAGQGIGKYDDDTAAASCTPFATHTVAPSLGDALHATPGLATAQTGFYYGFHDRPIECPAGTANGIGWLPSTPSGVYDVIFVWEE